MPSTRYTVRLPAALDAAVQAHLRATGLPFAVLIREALSAYLADTPPTGADTPRRGGRPSSPLRHQILALLREHPEGLRAEDIRVYVHAQRPIGDLLQGMVKGGVIRAQGRGRERRFVGTT
jgi:hypothetical protein